METRRPASIEAYLSAIEEYQNLDEADALRLCAQAKSGDVQARRELAESYIKTVVEIAMRIHPDDSRLIDAIHTGNVAIFLAIDSFPMDGTIGLDAHIKAHIEERVRKESRKKDAP